MRRLRDLGFISSFAEYEYLVTEAPLYVLEDMRLVMQAEGNK